MSGQKYGQYFVDNNETYFITYAGGKRELPKKDQDNYDKALMLPGVAQRIELNRLGLDKNPNVVPSLGWKLNEIIKDLKFIPFFDPAFALVGARLSVEKRRLDRVATVDRIIELGRRAGCKKLFDISIYLVFLG